MLEVTDAALAHLAKVLEKQEIPAHSDVTLRLIFDDELKLWRDAPQVGDEEYRWEGKIVLRVDERLAEVLQTNTLDVEEGALALRTPTDTH